MRTQTRLAPLCCLGLVVACGGAAQQATTAAPPPMNSPEPVMTSPTPPAPAPAADPQIAADIDVRLAKFAPVVLSVDEAALNAEHRSVLKKLVEASEIMQQLFIQQLDPESVQMRQWLSADPTRASALRYFDIMASPWDSLQHDEPFIGTKKRTPGAAFYPADMTQAEFDAAVAAHPERKDALMGYFTVIRRESGQLTAVPYAQAYSSLLERAASKLTEAAAISKEPTLQKFLRLRAEAFRTNQYRESDKAWMDVKGPIEVTIGPYETYADQLLGLKASFEAFVSMRDEQESKRLQIIGKEMGALERNLPLTAKLRARTEGRNQGSPIDVVHLLHNAGQSGVQTIAYNLPNDEHVRKEKGSKKVMLKNVMQGKFDRIATPIARRVLNDDLLPHLNFEAMFSFILMHEVAHGLGPGIIKAADGTRTEVNKALKEQYAGIEEAKADIAGLVSAQYLIDKNILPRSMEKQIYVAYLATVFRQVRFGTAEAHAKGTISSFNFLREKGAITVDAKTGRFGIDFSKMKPAVRELCAKYLEIEATGDYEGAKAFVAKYATPVPEMRTAIDQIGFGIPVDVAPTFAIVEKMKSW